ncbi:MAG: hypothetical protein RDV41_06665, partial [Planctomycetota bacterium]|nr:hypothetical protein [Planctomycetota bacterium]
MSDHLYRLAGPPVKHRGRAAGELATETRRTANPQSRISRYPATCCFTACTFSSACTNFSISCASC